MVRGVGRAHWFDGRVRFLVAVLVAVTAVLVSPAAAGTTPPDQTPPDPTTEPAPTTTAIPFLPEREDVSDCFSALPPPNCGSEDRGGSGQWLAFGAMVLGTVFIGWRIVRSVRRRDRVVSPGP